jgi:polyisoprenoid-binding protein YceI
MIRAAALLAILAAPAAAAETYALDPSHSQAMFSYEHLGYSTTWGLFSGFEGQVVFDKDAPANSTVSVSIATEKLFTGWPERDTTFLSADFFNAEKNPAVTFASTAIEVTGDATGKITGDLTINGITKSVVLDTTLTRHEPHPVEGKDWLGFTAETVLKRSDFGMGAFTPFIGDEVQVRISIEAGKAD